MNTFKEIIAAEAESVFLNAAEFAEIMTVNGREVTGLWGVSSLPAPDAHSDASAWGLATENAVLCLLEKDQPLPVPGEVLTVNGIRWSVVKAAPKAGIIRVEMQREVS